MVETFAAGFGRTDSNAEDLFEVLLTNVGIKSLGSEFFFLFVGFLWAGGFRF